jgi:hypothetical protein
MHRTLRILLQRDPNRDRQEGAVPYEGYTILWPDGRPIRVGFDAFCKHGQRLLGLGQALGERQQQLVELICFPQANREDRVNRLPGHRVRRFCLRRSGRSGRLYFLDGTPTSIVLNLDLDEPCVLYWFGLAALPDGGEGWFDLAARNVEETLPGPWASTAAPAASHFD